MFHVFIFVSSLLLSNCETNDIHVVLSFYSRFLVMVLSEF